MSKTDQLREGAAVSIGVTGDGLCPVSAVAAYLANYNARAQPLYQFADGRFLTADDINFWLGQLTEPGVTSHSLRTGGATRIAELGAPTWQLQASGRWRSNAYQRYLRPTRTAMGRLASAMAKSA